MGHLNMTDETDNETRYCDNLYELIRIHGLERSLEVCAGFYRVMRELESRPVRKFVPILVKRRVREILAEFRTDKSMSENNGIEGSEAYTSSPPYPPSRIHRIRRLSNYLLQLVGL